jgi:DNA-binding CsgD family transcriptional regulator
MTKAAAVLGDDLFDAATERVLEDLLFDGLTDRPIWSRFLKDLARYCRAREAFLVVQGSSLTTDLTAIVAPDPADATRIEAALSIDALRALPLAVASEVPMAAGQACALRVALPDARSIWLVVQCGTMEAASTAACLSRLSAMLARVLPLYELLGDAERKRRVAEYVIEASGTGTLLVEANGHVLSANAVAHQLMTAEGPLLVRDGTLRARTVPATRQLLEAIAEMARLQSTIADPGCYVPLALPDPDRAQPLTLIIRPGPPFGPVSAPLKRTAVIVLRDPALPAMLSVADLERLFGLSPAEARLATRLADGEGLDEAAVALGVSRNTARSQLQSVFAKTGINRQGDLVRLLLSSAASQGGSQRAAAR